MKKLINCSYFVSFDCLIVEFVIAVLSLFVYKTSQKGIWFKLAFNFNSL